MSGEFGVFILTGYYLGLHFRCVGSETDQSILSFCSQTREGREEQGHLHVLGDPCCRVET